MNSSTIEVAVGLVFCYATVALVTSSLYEAGASLLRLRASALLEGVKALLNDNAFTGLAKELYNHALINPRAPGTAADEKQLTVKPSYIDPQSFALALIDVLQKAAGAGADIGAAIDKVADPQLKELLLGMYRRAGGKIEALEGSLVRWFNDGMDRVSGAYKRQAQLMTLLIAVGLAIVLNVDTFRLFATLWRHPVLLAQVAIPDNSMSAVFQLNALPVGWGRIPTQGLSDWVVTALGWLVTGLTALFGAPFWFDLLQRLVRLRGTGPKPGDT